MIRVAALGLAAAAVACAQETAAPAAAPDWAQEVGRACTHPRYGLRLAAARRVAAGGDAAVPAVQAYAAAHGAAALPVALVEVIADDGGSGPATLGLLRGWADDQAFFWRAQALKGLARRARPDLVADAGRFEQRVTDPAWLTRAYAAWGLFRCSRSERAWRDVLADADPRARTRLAALLLHDGNVLGLSELVASLADERTFLGDPWGRRRALEAIGALKAKFGTDNGYRADADYEHNLVAIEAWHKATPSRNNRVPPPLRDAQQDWSGGIEVLSCQRGDLFVRWTAGGRIAHDLEDGQDLTLPAAVWRPLAESAAALSMPAQAGVVVCDKLRFLAGGGAVHGVAAPGALPAPVARWLAELAAALEQAGAAAQAAALRDRLRQFTAD